MNNRTYNNALLDEKSRAVFYKAMTKIDAALSDDTKVVSPERLHAYAACADASACGFISDEEDD